MQNNQNHVLSKCQIHSFSLKALHKERKHNLNASLSMCRAKQTKNKKSRNNCANYEGPILNRDRCHATPTFILPNQKVEYLQSARQILREHEKRVKESEEDIDQLYIPKPRSKNMYCNVCRQNYKEYLDHIRSVSHKSNIQNSQFNDHILQLQQKFKKNLTTDPAISSTDSRRSEQSQLSVEIIGVSGRKRVKTDSQEQYPRYYPFLNPSSPYAPFNGNCNPYSFSQFQALNNPYNQMLYSKQLMSNHCMNGMGFAPMNGFMQQQPMNFPQYFMAYQPNFPINAFQQQV